MSLYRPPWRRPVLTDQEWAALQPPVPLWPGPEPAPVELLGDVERIRPDDPLPEPHWPLFGDEGPYRGLPKRRLARWQRDLVEGYWLAVEAQNERAEAATLGYATELAEYFHPHDGTERRLTFREWLVHQEQPDEGWEDADLVDVDHDPGDEHLAA